MGIRRRHPAHESAFAESPDNRLQAQRKWNSF
jgi:hypothetical protein